MGAFEMGRRLTTTTVTGLARLLLTVSLCSSRREVQSGVEFVFDRALVADR